MNNFREIIHKTIVDFRSNIIAIFSVLALPIAIYSIATTAISHFSEIDFFMGIAAVFIEMAIGGLFIFSAINILSQKHALENVNSSTLIPYLVATLFVTIAAALGFMFFVIPGLFVMASSLLYPILILNDKQGPIEAVSNSVALTKGYTLGILIILAALWLSATAVEMVLPFIMGFNNVIDFVVSTIYQILYSSVSLICAPLIINVYSFAAAEHNE